MSRLEHCKFRFSEHKSLTILCTFQLFCTFKGRTRTAFQNWVLRNLFGPKREEATRYREESTMRSFKLLTNIIRTFVSKRFR